MVDRWMDDDLERWYVCSGRIMGRRKSLESLGEGRVAVVAPKLCERRRQGSNWKQPRVKLPAERQG